MNYMGSKRRVAQYFQPTILAGRAHGQAYVEPFVGGCNMIDKVVGGPKIAADNNKYLIAMWSALQAGWMPPSSVTEDEYKLIKTNKDEYPAELVGFVGFNCSFGAKFFGGYARDNRKPGTTTYPGRAARNISKQLAAISDVDFVCCHYSDLVIPMNSIIYCDPPYAGTSNGYGKDRFDSEAFWQWCRAKVYEGHKVFVSEYKAPSDFVCAKAVVISCHIDKRHVAKNSLRIEKLFIHRSQSWES